MANPPIAEPLVAENVSYVGGCELRAQIPDWLRTPTGQEKEPRFTGLRCFPKVELPAQLIDARILDIDSPRIAMVTLVQRYHGPHTIRPSEVRGGSPASRWSPACDVGVGPFEVWARGGGGGSGEGSISDVDRHISGVSESGSHFAQLL